MADSTDLTVSSSNQLPQPLPHTTLQSNCPVQPRARPSRPREQTTPTQPQRPCELDSKTAERCMPRDRRLDPTAEKGRCAAQGAYSRGSLQRQRRLSIVLASRHASRPMHPTRMAPGTALARRCLSGSPARSSLEEHRTRGAIAGEQRPLAAGTTAQSFCVPESGQVGALPIVATQIERMSHSLVRATHPASPSHPSPGPRRDLPVEFLVEVPRSELSVFAKSMANRRGTAGSNHGICRGGALVAWMRYHPSAPHQNLRVPKRANGKAYHSRAPRGSYRHLPKGAQRSVPSYCRKRQRRC